MKHVHVISLSALLVACSSIGLEGENVTPGKSSKGDKPSADVDAAVNDDIHRNADGIPARRGFGASSLMEAAARGRSRFNCALNASTTLVWAAVHFIVGEVAVRCSVGKRVGKALLPLGHVLPSEHIE